MLLWYRLTLSVLAVVLGLALSGCSLPGDGQQDDEKEPHYVLGKSRVNALDYAGAAEAFEEALDVNPHSAAAHYQLAWLYENELSDPASAIYHYQEYLKFDPKAENRDVINQHIFSCKQQLVKDVMQLPSTPAAQMQIEKLAEQNRKLQDDNKRMQDELDKWHAYYAAEIAAHPAAQQTYAPAGPEGGSTVMDSATQYTGRGTAAIPGNPRPNPPAPPRMRTHTVASGETLAAIARKAGCSLASLESANPGLNPRHLRAGQTINLPSP